MDPRPVLIVTGLVQEAKIAAEALRGILRDFDNFSDEPEEFVSRVLQIRGQFSIG